MMVEREVAYRVFAKELNDSRFVEGMSVTASVHEDIHSPNYVVIPSGAMVNRVLISGVLTEVDRLGEDGEGWKARIVDPSGPFTLYAGQYQSDALSFFSSIEVPDFVCVVGKVRVYERPDGSVAVIIRPEEINRTDERSRDRWVIDTGELTLGRIECFSKLIRSIDGGKASVDPADNSKELSKPCEAFTDKEYLSSSVSCISENDARLILEKLPGTGLEHLCSLREMVRDCILSLGTGLVDDNKDVDKIILELLNELGKGKAVKHSDIIQQARKMKIADDSVEDALISLLSKGECYEPKAGMYKVIN